jgi:broad specificity phosphatase PhoE
MVILPICQLLLSDSFKLDSSGEAFSQRARANLRAGETEWTNSGQYTGRSDIPLTPHGELQVLSSSHVVIGPGKLIDPKQLAKVYISPRTRAKRTYEILFDENNRDDLKRRAEITEDIREWEYGLYEGKLTADIRAGRKERGLDREREWNIWRDGCEDGESPEQVTKRLDDLIARIREIQAPFMNDDGKNARHVVIIAHGHSLRAFAKRWIGFELQTRLPMMLEPGAVGVMSYEHHKVDEPALLLGVNLGEKSEIHNEATWRYC